jgi:putative ABC transport system permease protein
MLRVALRGLAARRLRSALTGLAVVLGVALVAGTYVLTDSITGAFDRIYNVVYSGTDATITGRSAISSSTQQAPGSEPSFSQSLLARVRRLPDVAAATGGVAGTPQLILHGRSISFGGAPNLGYSVDPSAPRRLAALDLVRGRWPRAAEVAVDSSTATRKHLRVGEAIGVQADGPVRQMRISGFVRLGGSASIGGATLAAFSLPTAQALFHKRGELDQIRVAARSGISPQRLVAQIRTILPPDTQARTAAQQARQDASATDSFLSFLRTFLLVFAGIALFVGSFVIANSLSITIAQRTRELATLRTLGATRRQVLRSVLVESLALGIIASAVGLGVGIGLAQGLFALFDATGLTLPTSGTVLHVRTIIVALLVGIAVTLLASLRPAMRATGVPPIAAVREGATIAPGSSSRWRDPLSFTAALLGFAAVALGLFVAHGTGGQLGLMGGGAVLVFIGLAMFSARAIPRLALWIGWPSTVVAGAVGRLARENARRNPQRTASTAAALMIGLALVTLVAMMSAGIISNFRGAVNRLFSGDYAITAQNNFSPLPTSVGAAAGRALGVVAVGDVRTGEGRVFGSDEQLTAVDPGIAAVVRLNWADGSQRVLRTLGTRGAIVSDGYARQHRLTVGSPVTITTPAGTRVTDRIEGIFRPPSGGSPFGAVTISARRWDALYPRPQNLYSFVKVRGGASAAALASLRHALRAYPGAKLQTRHQFVDNQISGLSAVLNILYVLLGLSIVVSLFGIVNTLVLSVFERTREIGMLRAVGTSRRQVRRMIRHESVITALIGSTLGILLGIAFGALLAARVDSIAFVVPVRSLIIFLVASWLVGLLAAVFPARRAARLAPLQALAYE